MGRPMLWLWRAALLGMLAFALGSAQAQESAEPSPEVAAEVERLLSALDEPAVREALREALIAQAQVAGTEPSGDSISVAQERVAKLLEAWDELDDELGRVAEESLTDGKTGVVTYALVLALVGAVAAFAASRALRRLRDRARPDPAGTLGSRLMSALGLILIELGPVVAFLAGVNLLALAWREGVVSPHETAAVVSRASLWIFAVAIAVDVLWSPSRPESGLLRPTRSRARLAAWVLVGGYLYDQHEKGNID